MVVKSEKTTFLYKIDNKEYFIYAGKYLRYLDFLVFPTTTPTIIGDISFFKDTNGDINIEVVE